MSIHSSALRSHSAPETSPDMNKYLEAAKNSSSKVTNLSSLIEYMKQDAREKYAEYGAVNFEKADKITISDGEMDELFKMRQSKGLEIHKILDEHNCDAMIVPAHCHNPSDLAQCPVMCLPMGFYSAERAVEHSDGNLVSKGHNIPSACSYPLFLCFLLIFGNRIGLLFICRKWDEHRMIALGYAYEQASAKAIRAADKPIYLPTAELRDQLKSMKCEKSEL